MKSLLTKLELFYFATDIPLRLYDSNNLQISSYMLSAQKKPGFLLLEDYERAILTIGHSTCYFTSNLNEHYYSFSFEYNGAMFKILAGPTIDYIFNREYLIKIINEMKLKLSYLNVLECYFRSLPVYTPSSLRRTEPLLRFLLCGEDCDPSIELSNNDLTCRPEEKSVPLKGVKQYHHGTTKDTLIFEAIKNGDREHFYTLMYSPSDGPDGILCRNNPVRSYKNLFIVTVTHTTKAAIDGGVNSETAYTLSDTFIQTVEDIDSYEKITELFIDMFNSFLDLVEKANKCRYTSPVLRTIEYINRHYYENILIKGLANSVHLSESYLLKLFKEQTGMSIKAYIINKRIREVKNLLKYTDYDISVICEMTGFSDQSYMTNMFRKSVGMTPNKYRTE